MSRLDELVRRRVNGLGRDRFGDYVAGRYPPEEIERQAKEELADLVAYAVRFHRVERPTAGTSRRLVKRAAELLWRALELQLQDALAEPAPRHRTKGRRRPKPGVERER